MTVSSATSSIGTERLSLNEHHVEFPDLDDAQSISGSNIDPAKLTMLLRVKFGAGSYDIYIMHNSYCIIAPRKLSAGEIARCRRR
ncbi:uncharacterized protein K460DRAFT_361536 [Cucurbitaria berberidis CBS 394.84]|uniref:Uncharacterized protein n=1 Tax=Cucurbitaria berberidis CBS 394.84 TaxID=1168544 RepID=A0A9P4GSL9_9PLEO|nr:uncharacterized protein K460DRAFT_361536 [Cucurbitaria berberidis CBS 394.84]KAF1850769.1 hypothetical protein K460DRAFT_361536 [Cucurbitaria berberidis CBS 394.84]